MPDAVDEDGCIVVVPDRLGVENEDPERSCPEGDGTGPIDEEVVSGPPESLEVALVGAKGYMGPRYASAVPLTAGTPGMYVLEDTVRIEQTGDRVTILGLVRNETTEVAPSIEVEAELHSKSGEVVIAKDTALVTNVRPGEPVPFQLTASKVGDVDRASWSASVVDSGPVNRDAVPSLLGTYLAGDREPLVLSDYDESKTEAPYPYVLIGRLAYYGDGELSDIAVTLGWLDNKTGQLVGVATMSTVTPGSSATKLAGFGADGAADFFFTDDGGLATAAADAEPVVWVTART